MDRTSTTPPDRTAEAWDERYAACAPWGAEPNVWVRHHTESLRPGRALDLACGDGRHALWLASRGWEVSAVDFSAAAVARGRAAEQAARAAAPAANAVPAATAVPTPPDAVDRPAPIDWHVADLTTPDLTTTAPGHADLVLLAYFHLPEPTMTAVLTRAAAALAPGGTLVLVGHDRTNLTDGVGGPQDASVLTDAPTVAATLTAGGLDVVVAEVARRPVPSSDRPALDTVVVARRPTAPTYKEKQ